MLAGTWGKLDWRSKIRVDKKYQLDGFVVVVAGDIKNFFHSFLLTFPVVGRVCLCVCACVRARVCVYVYVYVHVWMRERESSVCLWVNALLRMWVRESESKKWILKCLGVRVCVKRERERAWMRERHREWIDTIMVQFRSGHVTL